MNPQIVQALLAKLGGGGAMGGGAPISFANSGGARPPIGVGGGAGAGVGGGGQGGYSYPGASTAGLNRVVGAPTNMNTAGLGSEGSIQGGEAGMMQNPQMMNKNPSVSVLTDLTSGVGPPLGTAGYGVATQGNVGNPAGDSGPFSMGLAGGSPTSSGTNDNVMGRDLANLIQPGDKSNMGRTITKGRPAMNSMPINNIFPQTGLQQYNGVLG